MYALGGAFGYCGRVFRLIVRIISPPERMHLTQVTIAEIAYRRNIECTSLKLVLASLFAQLIFYRTVV